MSVEPHFGHGSEHGEPAAAAQLTPAELFATVVSIGF
jgi:hypothetical protein